MFFGTTILFGKNYSGPESALPNTIWTKPRLKLEGAKLISLQVLMKAEVASDSKMMTDVYIAISIRT